MSDGKKQEEIKLPPTELTVTLEGENYDISFNNGQLMDIEVMRAKLADGRQSDILYSGRQSGYFVSALIDTIAHITVLVPEFKKKLSRPISELKPIEVKPFIEVYVNEIQPWMNGWFKVLNDISVKDQEQ